MQTISKSPCMVLERTIAGATAFPLNSKEKQCSLDVRFGLLPSEYKDLTTQEEPELGSPTCTACPPSTAAKQWHEDVGIKGIPPGDAVRNSSLRFALGWYVMPLQAGETVHISHAARALTKPRTSIFLVTAAEIFAVRRSWMSSIPRWASFPSTVFPLRTVAK